MWNVANTKHLRFSLGFDVASGPFPGTWHGPGQSVSAATRLAGALGGGGAEHLGLFGSDLCYLFLHSCFPFFLGLESGAQMSFWADILGIHLFSFAGNVLSGSWEGWMFVERRLNLRLLCQSGRFHPPRLEQFLSLHFVWLTRLELYNYEPNMHLYAYAYVMFRYVYIFLCLLPQQL